MNPETDNATADTHTETRISTPLYLLKLHTSKHHNTHLPLCSQRHTHNPPLASPTTISLPPTGSSHSSPNRIQTTTGLGVAKQRPALAQDYTGDPRLSNFATRTLQRPPSERPHRLCSAHTPPSPSKPPSTHNSKHTQGPIDPPPHRLHRTNRHALTNQRPCTNRPEAHKRSCSQQPYTNRTNTDNSPSPTNVTNRINRPPATTRPLPTNNANNRASLHQQPTKNTNKVSKPQPHHMQAHKKPILVNIDAHCICRLTTINPKYPNNTTPHSPRRTALQRTTPDLPPSSDQTNKQRHKQETTATGQSHKREKQSTTKEAVTNGPSHSVSKSQRPYTATGTAQTQPSHHTPNMSQSIHQHQLTIQDQYVEFRQQVAAPPSSFHNVTSPHQPPNAQDLEAEED